MIRVSGTTPDAGITAEPLRFHRLCGHPFQKTTLTWGRSSRRFSAGASRLHTGDDMTAVTIRHVAREAGVSVKTVSRVINHDPAVHVDTREKVQRTIRDLGFRPNPLARSLVAKRTRTLGLVVQDVSNPFFAPLVYGCLSVTERKGYHLVVDTGGSPDVENEHLRALLDQRVSGIILWASCLSGEAMRDVLDQAHPSCPIVFIDCNFDGALMQPFPHHSLRVDNRQVGVLATEHLLNEGRRRVAHVGSTLSSGDWGGTQRRDGYLQTLAAAGLRPEAHWVRDGVQSTIQAGALATLAMLDERPCPDSIFAVTDITAVGALLACRKKGLRVPDDIAIVGVDDTQLAAVTDPPLTTIRLHQHKTGEHAAALLLDLIEAGASSTRPHAAGNEGVVLPAPELVVRRSSTSRAIPDIWLDDLPLSHG